MIEALKKAMELADSAINSTLEELCNKHNAELEALRKEKDEELSALRKEKDNDIAGLRAELAELKTLVDENKTEADANIEKLSSVDTTQKDHMEGLQTVSYIGLGIAGVSFAANIVLLAQMLMKKRKPFVK